MDASETKLEEISFEVGDGFGYLFDFGDEWQHDIELLEIVPVEKTGEEPPPQYEDAEPPIVIHPELLKLVKRKCPRWDGDPDCIFVDEHDNIPAQKDVKNFVRGKVIVSVMGMKSCDFQADFPSLKSLFRKDTMVDAYCNNFFISFVRNAIEALVENEYIANVNNDAFIKIFSVMADDPDSPSQSFLHNMIWTAAACNNRASPGMAGKTDSRLRLCGILYARRCCLE